MIFESNSLFYENHEAMKQIDLNNETVIYQSEVARPSWISSWKEKQAQ